MNYFTNNIKTATGYQRDSTLRTASEKLLDKHFYQSDRHKELVQQQIKSTAATQLQQQEPRKKKKLESTPQQKQPSTEQVLERITKLFDNPNKVTKSLEVLRKFITTSEEAFRKTECKVKLGLMFRLVQLSLRLTDTIQDKARLEIAGIFTTLYKMDIFASSSTEAKQIATIFGIAGRSYCGLHSDDTFEFNKHLGQLLKIIQTFEFDQEKASAYQEMKKQVKGEDLESGFSLVPFDSAAYIDKLLTSQEERISQKRELIYKVALRLMKLGRVAWAKVSVDQFLRKFNLNHRRTILTPQQEKSFGSAYENYLNAKIKDQLSANKQHKIDSQILGNAVSSRHEIKDARTTGFAGDASDTWSQRQM